MTALQAVGDGIGRVRRAPALVIGVWAMTLVVSLPLTIALRGMLVQHLGRSLAAETAASGVNYDWMQEFSDQATGLGVTFRPTVIGFGAVLDNLSAFLDDTTRPVVITGAASAYVFLWIFVAGGLIDRLARDRATRAPAFFSACGVYFFRFLQLAIVQGIVYALLFGVVHPWLFGRIYPQLTHDVAVERTAFAIRAGLYVVFGSVLVTAMTVFDYAKVRAVVEDRRNMLGAMIGALRFIRRNFVASFVVFKLNIGLFAVVVAGYALVAPDAGGTGVSMWAALLVGQLYVLARLFVKLTFWASETALFQARLAHAGYVARPEPTWPESPAAEAIL